MKFGGADEGAQEGVAPKRLEKEHKKVEIERAATKAAAFVAALSR